MKAATLIRSSDGFQLEFFLARSCRPTFDLRELARLLDALEIDVVDVRLGGASDEAEQLSAYCEALREIRRYRATGRLTQ